jgi:arsenate reductase (thioredoxin)
MIYRKNTIKEICFMKILFMCVANSARSQLAEGLARKILGPKFEVQSAGSHPGRLNPFAVEVMKEVGIDIGMQYSKSISELEPSFVEGLDYVITLCAEEVCPMIISQKAKRVHWPFVDPASEEILPDSELLIRFRIARDGITKALEKFKMEIGI